jgi:small GTP-binding protein
MYHKKVCMLGTFAVGKTSLVARFVSSIFSDKYHTTIGVKIDKRELETAAGPVTLMLWDIYGDDEFQSLRPSFLRGSAGYFLVADGTRRATLERLPAMQRLVEQTIGKAPYVILLNKADLESQWEIGEADIRTLSELGPVLRTSAKTGQGVEEAFTLLTDRIMHLNKVDE